MLTKSPTRNLTQALHLAQVGFRVFPYYGIANGQCTCSKPCTSPGKHPRIRGYLQQATTDPTQIRTWWTRWPDSGIGICPDNQLILDIDGPQGHTNLQALQKHFQESLPPTYTCQSGNAKPHHYHLYYRIPLGTRLLNKPLSNYPGLKRFTHIDVRTNCGQIAAPGTQHKSGKPYCWVTGGPYQGLGYLNDVRELPEAPLWLFLALEDPQQAQHTTRDFRVQRKAKETPSRGQENSDLPNDVDEFYLQIIRNRWPITGPGQRNNLQGKPITYLLARGLPKEQVTNLMIKWLETFSGNYSTPWEQAVTELCGSIKRSLQNLEAGKIKLIPDHDKQTAHQKLHPRLAEFFDSKKHLTISYGVSETKKQSNDLSVSRSPPAVEFEGCQLTCRRAQFFMAILLHYQYRVFEFGENRRIKMTHSQIQAILRQKFQVSLGRRQLYEHADLFITRLDQNGLIKKAEVLELLYQIRRGKSGVPSEYGITGLPSIRSIE